MRKLSELQKACIGSYVDGHMELDDRFYVPFNPAEIAIEEAIGVNDISQIGGRRRQKLLEEGNSTGYQHGVQPYGEKRPGSPQDYRQQGEGTTVLSVTLFFNTMNDFHQDSYQDVREEIRRLYPYTNTEEEMTAKGRKQIYFFWGSIAVAGSLRHMSVNYTMFAPDGKPVRAQVSISIAGFYVGEENASGNKAAAAPKSGVSANKDKVFGSSGDFSKWKENYQGTKNPRL